MRLKFFIVLAVLLGTLPAFGQSDPTLVGYWKFDEGTGDTAYDASGYGNNGTLMNGPVWVNGILGKALEFDGIDDYVEVPDNLTLRPPALTLMAWMKPNRLPSSGWTYGPIVKRTPEWESNANWQMQVWWTGQVNFAYYNAGWHNSPWSSNSIDLEQWNHLAITFQDREVKIYFNGELDPSFPSTMDADLNTEFTSPVIIGKGWGDKFEGIIDEVKIYSRALSAEEIEDEFDTTLVGYWKFDEGTGDTAYDASGYGNNGTLMNGPVWVNGILGNALEFDGIDDYVIISDSPSLDIDGPGITFMAWIYSPAFQDLGWIIGKGEEYLSDLVWGLLPKSDGAIRYWIKSGGIRHEQWDIPVGLATATWQHVAVVYDGSYMRFYLNAVEKDSFPKTGNMDVNDEPVYIGLDGWNQSNHYRGIIDEVKVYSRALSEEEIWEEFEKVFAHGDINGDEYINLGDVIYLANYLLKGGPAPVPPENGDVNCDKSINLSDVIYLANYLLKGGPPPC